MASAASSLQDVEIQEPTLQMHQFSELFVDRKIFFQIIFLKDSYFVWIGTEPSHFGSLSVSMPNPFDSLPSVTSLNYESPDSSFNSLALRLTKRTGKPFYISNGLPSALPMLNSFAEKRLLQELQGRL